MDHAWKFEAEIQSMLVAVAIETRSNAGVLIAEHMAKVGRREHSGQ